MSVGMVLSRSWEALMGNGQPRDRADWHAVDGVQDRTSSDAKKPGRQSRRPGWYLAETVGFEPTVRFLSKHSLSRGAPSASRSRLRGRFPGSGHWLAPFTSSESRQATFVKMK